MPFRLVPATVLLLLLAGCAPAAAPTPEPTTAPPVQTLRTLIDASPESPELGLGTETPADGFRTIEATYLSEGLTIAGVVYLPDGPDPSPASSSSMEVSIPPRSRPAAIWSASRRTSRSPATWCSRPTCAVSADRIPTRAATPT